ncbi:MAG: (2Fe-2S)-binding protein [Gammaproteobacteria bacterium]|nr:(2Fe-2S)-binding protein [Gammaproteobacteria bacterium]MCY4296150.1 (2Fe-2S)-binding protein [Gammaproteobacteria bacterium]
MYVCICRQITESQIRDLCRESGDPSLSNVRSQLGVGIDCGKCGNHTRSILREYHQSASFNPTLATAIPA